MILGVVLAGGQSSRFGSDKALAELGGRTLLTRAIDALTQCCDRVVVAGRASAPAPTVADWPGPGQGPLGGIAAGLRLAQHEAFELVLTIGVDSQLLPDDLFGLLAPAPSYLADQPVVGLWPASAAQAAEALLQNGRRRSMRAFAETIGAQPVKMSGKTANINTQADLAAAEKIHGI